MKDVGPNWTLIVAIIGVTLTAIGILVANGINIIGWFVPRKGTRDDEKRRTERDGVAILRAIMAQRAALQAGALASIEKSPTRSAALFSAPSGAHLPLLRYFDPKELTRVRDVPLIWRPELREPIVLNHPKTRWVSSNIRAMASLPTYRLLGADGGTLEFCRTTYFNYYETGDALVWDLARSIAKRLSSSDRQVYLELDRQGPAGAFPHNTARTLRNRIQSELSLLDQLDIEPRNPFDLRNRHVAVGICTLTILARANGEHQFILHDRGTAARSQAPGSAAAAHEHGHVTEAIGTVHVVPAGSFQGISMAPNDRAEEFSIDFTIAREFAEELFDQDITPADGTPLASLSSASQEALALVRKIARAIHDGRCPTYFFGIGLDLLTQKAEALTCIVFPAALLESGDLGVSDFKPNREGVLDCFESFKREQLEVYLNHWQEKRLLGAACGCLAGAHQHFDALVKIADECAALEQQRMR